MHNNINTLFEYLWQNYLCVTPTATKIHKLLGSTQNNDIINDHIALRTFDLEKVSLEKLAKHFTSLGYKECNEYNFEDKKIHAKHYEHPNIDNPKVFISELQVERFSPVIQEVIHFLVSQVDEDMILNDDFLSNNYHNDCEALVSELHPPIHDAITWLSHYSSSRLTGTGACCFARFNSESQAQQVLDEARSKFKGFIAKGVNLSPAIQRLNEAKRSQ